MIQEFIYPTDGYAIQVPNNSRVWRELFFHDNLFVYCACVYYKCAFHYGLFCHENLSTLWMAPWPTIASNTPSPNLAKILIPFFNRLQAVVRTNSFFDCHLQGLKTFKWEYNLTNKIGIGIFIFLNKCQYTEMSFSVVLVVLHCQTRGELEVC